MEFTPALLVTFILNGLSIAMVLILFASGLSIVAGMIDVINIAHGSLFMLGAYFAVSLLALTGNYFVALIVAPLFVMLVAVLLEVFTIRPLYTRDPVYNLLLTFGLSLILINAVQILWGPDVQTLPIPSMAQGRVSILGAAYPKYRVMVLVFCTVIMLAILAFFRYSNYGLILRAGISDIEMLNALGVNISRTFTWVYAGGAGLAAVAGIVVGPLLTVYPEMGFEIIIDGFIVLVIGGMGSLTGAIIGSLILGMAESFGVLIIPGFTKSIIYGVMVLVLVFFPRGLFGGVEVE